MAQRIQLRRDTAANWTSVNPTLAQGELGLETDTNKLKFGDGSTAWASLTYFSGTLTLAQLATLAQTATADTASLDADTWNFYDAVDAVLKKITWANIKATLKTYFDTIYTTTSEVATQISTALSGYLTSSTAASTYVPFINAATALSNSATLTLTAIRHTLTTTQAAITFSDTYTGDFIDVEVTFTQTAATWTFPAGSLCVFGGTASGDNTMAVTGVSGDKIILSRMLINGTKYYIALNFGQ